MKLNPGIIDQDVIELGRSNQSSWYSATGSSSTLDGHYQGQSVPTRPGRPGTLPAGTPYPGQAVPVKIVDDFGYSCRNSISRTVRPRCCTAVWNCSHLARPTQDSPAPLLHSRLELFPSGTPYPGQSGPAAGRRFAPAGTPSGFNEDAAQGVATFVQLFTGLLSGSDVPLPVSPDLDNFIAEIANAQFPAIEIDVIPRFNWEGGNLQGPPPNSYWHQGQGGTLQGPAQGPQTQADRSDDRRHSNSRTSRQSRCGRRRFSCKRPAGRTYLWNINHVSNEPARR